MENLSRRMFLEKLGISTSAFAVSLPAFARPLKEIPEINDGKKLNVALCGLGNYAGLLADGLKNSQYCRLAGIVTGHPAKAIQWQKDYDIPQQNIYDYQNFDDVANNKNIDLVYIALPNFLHKEFTIRSARAGKHVISEKPMSVSVQDCEDMIAACEQAGVQLGIGYRMHFEPTQLEIKRLGQEKIFGRLRFMEAALGYKTYDTTSKTAATFNINDPAEWRLKKSKAGGGPLMDIGIYCIQACRYVSGEEPVSVTAQFGKTNDQARFAEVEESITWQMQFPGGMLSSCTSSFGFNIDRLYATADNGFFELAPALSYGPFKGKTSDGLLELPVTNQQTVQMDAIGKTILAGKPLPDHISGKEGLKDIRIITAIYEAAKTGSSVALK